LYIYKHAKHGSVFDLATVVKPMFSVHFGLLVQAIFTSNFKLDFLHIYYM